jgi:hypothetical protein
MIINFLEIKKILEENIKKCDEIHAENMKFLEEKNENENENENLAYG